MRKIFFLLTAILITVLLAAAGCSPKLAGAPGVQAGEIESEPETEMVEYEVWKAGGGYPEELSEEMEDIIQNLKKERGYFIFNPQTFQTGEDLFILISSGEKPTGGYSSAIENVLFKDDTLEITVEEKKPSQEDAVIQVLTYPALLLKLKGTYEFFAINNTAGEAFPPLSPEREKVMQSASGTLVGRIDSNSVEIECNGEAQAFYLEEQSLIDNFIDGEKITFDYYKDQYDRLIINKIEKDG